MKVLSEFDSPTGEKLTARVYLSEANILAVDFFRDQRLVGTTEFPNNNLQYVEDAAENFVMKVGHFDF